MEAEMSKKEKSVFALAEDIQAVIAVVPRIEALIKAHKEISAGYQKYRKNGGEAITGIEKHLGIIPAKETVKAKAKNAAPKTEVKAPKKDISAKIASKKK